MNLTLRFTVIEIRSIPIGTGTEIWETLWAPSGVLQVISPSILGGSNLSARKNSHVSGCRRSGTRNRHSL